MANPARQPICLVSRCGTPAFDAERTRGTDTAAAAARQMALDWLESQARILAFWQERLVADGEAGGLVEMIETHRAWLTDRLWDARRAG